MQEALDIHEALPWADLNLVESAPRSDLKRHLRQAAEEGLDFDCCIGAGLAGKRAVWVWSFAGRFYAFRLTEDQGRRFAEKANRMSIRTRPRYKRPEPARPSAMIEDVRIERNPLIAGEPIPLTVTWKWRQEDRLPWGARLDILHPQGNIVQHWASAENEGRSRLRFSPVTEAVAFASKPLTGVTPAFLGIWHVPDGSTTDHRVPLSQTVGVLLDLRLPGKNHGRVRRVKGR